MTLGDFREVILEKSVGRTTLPEDKKLFERVHTAIKRVAKDTVPLSLVQRVDSTVSTINFKVLRRIDTNSYIRFPEKPESNESVIDVDEALLDATALYIIAGLERGHAKVHMGMYYGEIDMNNDRLIETALSIASNDSYNEEPYV
jgi:hypothetical protein